VILIPAVSVDAERRRLGVSTRSGTVGRSEKSDPEKGLSPDEKWRINTLQNIVA
jgi:hypothetical protein